MGGVRGRTEVVVRHAEVEERGRGALDVNAALIQGLGKRGSSTNIYERWARERTLAAWTSPSSSFCVPSSRHCMASTSPGSTVVDCSVVEVAHPEERIRASRACRWGVLTSLGRRWCPRREVFLASARTREGRTDSGSLYGRRERASCAPSRNALP